LSAFVKPDFSHVSATVSATVEGPKKQWGNKGDDFKQPSWHHSKIKGGDLFAPITPVG